MHEISISGDFLRWISYLCQISSVLVISMTRIFHSQLLQSKYCCRYVLFIDLAAISVHVLVAVFGY